MRRQEGSAGAFETRAAAVIEAAYDDYQARFLEITQRSADRFNRRDWHGVDRDAVEIGRAHV